MIDLHTHTTASDGLCSPAELVARAGAAGVTVLAVTDHDTVAAVAAVAEAAAAAGIESVPGIEITAVADETDVHVLGYFIDAHSPALLSFLAEQRQRRIDRVRQIIAKLASFGLVLDAEAIVKPAMDDRTKSAGRPWIARALMAAGHVDTVGEAFDRWLARGRPAFIPRLAASPAETVERIHGAGGLASLAHPGVLARDVWIASFAKAGLDALEAYHTDHDAAATAKYLSLADGLGLAVTGGSDYHADESHAPMPGATRLPVEQYQRLKARPRR